MKNVWMVMLFACLSLHSYAALSPKALETKTYSNQRFGQGVEIKIDGNFSLNQVELYFYGNLKPVDSTGTYFLTNSQRTIIGFNISEATENQHPCVVYEDGGTIRIISDCGSFLAKKLQGKLGKLDPDSFILYAVENNILNLGYETHMQTGSLVIKASILNGSLNIIRCQKSQ